MWVSVGPQTSLLEFVSTWPSGQQAHPSWPLLCSKSQVWIPGCSQHSPVRGLRTTLLSQSLSCGLRARAGPATLLCRVPSCPPCVRPSGDSAPQLHTQNSPFDTRQCSSTYSHISFTTAISEHFHPKKKSIPHEQPPPIPHLPPFPRPTPSTCQCTPCLCAWPALAFRVKWSPTA